MDRTHCRFSAAHAALRLVIVAASVIALAVGQAGGAWHPMNATGDASGASPDPTPSRPAQSDPKAVDTNCVVLVHPDNPLDDLALETLTHILRAEQQRWTNGNRILLALPPSPSTERDVLLKVVFKMDEKELKKYWTHLLYRNKIAQLPKTEADSAAMIALVEKQKDAIAVVAVSAIPKSAKVRIITIDKKSPAAPDYSLRLVNK